MSSDSTKKRRIAEGSNNGDIGLGSDPSSTAAIIAEMKEHMICMQNKIDGMQNEMNGMKSRLSRMDELAKKCEQQEEKCNILEGKCESLVRGMRVLSKESTWEYSAPPIPTSHWTGLGFDEDYINDIEELVNVIRNKTNTIREEGRCMGGITLGEESNPNGAAGALLQYDNVLLPHWEELATALELCQSNNIEFTIQNVQLTTSVTDVLMPAFKGKLQDLFLDNNGFVDSREGTKFMAKCMEINRQMKEFYLSNNQLESVENAHLVLDAIISHPSIVRVRLENCLGGDINGYDALCYLLASAKQFDTVDFDRNNIHTRDGTAIPYYITNNPPLMSLLLSGNKLNDDDATLIASALKKNNNLRHLYLYDNDITDIGKEALFKAIYDPTSLNSLFECNHSCQIQMEPMEDGSAVAGGLPSFCKNTGHSNPKTIRCMKMHYILSLRHRERSNVQHLNTEFKDEDDEYDSLKLVPNVLEAVYKNSHNGSSRGDPIRPLTIMYEVMRGWKMPELYGIR